MRKFLDLLFAFKCLIEHLLYFSLVLFIIISICLFGLPPMSAASNPSIKTVYEKYTAELNNNYDIPTLESLFQKVTFRDNGNSSSGCPHEPGIKRDTLCHKIITFDRDGYEKSIKDTKKLILNRLNLDHEPKIEINKNTLSFIEQLENSIMEEDEDDERQFSTMKTKYDMKRYETKEFNSMHEASGLYIFSLASFKNLFIILLVLHAWDHMK